MIQYGIIGATGHTAQELLSLTSLDKNLKCVFLTSSSQAGDFSEFLPEQPYEDISFEEISARKPDIVFFATPHGVCMKDAKKFLNSGIKVIDLSGDFRFTNTNIFEKNYNITHLAPEISEKISQYGLTEHFRSEISHAPLIANPGCYVTASLNALLPIKKEIKSAVCDGKSGFSGAGKSFSKKNKEDLEKNICIPYTIIQHRHEAEIQQFFPNNIPISFTPHLINTFRGMIVTVHIFLQSEISEEEIFQKFLEYYKDEKYIKIQKKIPEISDIQGKNINILGGFKKDDSGRIVIISALDNLRKGAVSQALQNMYVLMNVEEIIPNTGKRCLQ